ncbi:hypothetical protein D3C71_1087620 [compost metagenome]
MADIAELWQAVQGIAATVTPGLLEVLKALAAPIIAVAALRVSRQQVRINENKLKLHLYDRRLKVYAAVKDLLTALSTVGTLRQAHLAAFRNQVVEADFLFGEDVQRYIALVDGKARSLIIETHKNNRPRSDDAESITDPYERVDELHDWFLDQHAEAKRIFRSFLSLNS